MSSMSATTSHARPLLLVKIIGFAIAMLVVLLLLFFPSGTAAAVVNYPVREMLVASNYASVSGAHLGSAASVSGDAVVVGAPDEDGGKGAVYVYVRPENGWLNITATETATLTLPAEAAFGGELFGSSVSISGDSIVVGATGENLGTGAAYVYVRPQSGWSPTSTYAAKLTHPADAIGESFGESVSISGDTIVIGAPAAGTAGKAYVYERPPSGWASVTASVELSNTLAGLEEDFGSSVATHADTIVVGAPKADIGAEADQGAAYVYEKAGDNWTSAGTPTEVLTATGDADDNFGVSVAIREDGKAIVVGADNAARPLPAAANGVNVPEPDQGAAYVFMRPSDSWASASPIESDFLSSGSSGSPGDFFGRSVSISNDTIVVGAPEYRTIVGIEQLKTGSTFVFVQPKVGPTSTPETAWESTDTADAVLFDAVKGQDKGEFGEAVATFGGTIVVGAPYFDLPAAAAIENQGIGYVYENGFCSAKSGSWHNGDTWVGGTPPTGTVDACISTGHIVTMDAVPVTNQAAIVEPEVVQIRRLLIDPNGTLDLDMFDIDVGEQVINNGTFAQRMMQSGGTGWVEMLKIQSDSTPTVFRGADISSTQDLGGVTLTLRTAVDWFSPTAKYNFCTSHGAVSPAYAKRCFAIDPANSHPSEIRLWALLDELNGVPESDLMVYRYAGSAWEGLAPATVGTGFTGIGYINVTGPSAGFSNFLMGDKNFAPTAVNLTSFAAAEDVDEQTVPAAAVALLALGSVVLLHYRRRKPTT